MKQFIYATAIATVSAFALHTAAFAQVEDQDAPMQLSKAECDSLWNQVNPSGAATITESQAQPYITDFAAANPDGDGTLDSNEFFQACSNGLVQSSAASGAGTGESGISTDEADPQMSPDESVPGASGSETYK
jgi:hypothetical protein